MKTKNIFYSTTTSSLKNNHNMLSISNLKLINKPKIYHPINPSHPFHFDLLNLKEISKRKNALLINNKPLKDKILKYSLDERKNSNENNDPNKYLFNRFKDEEKKYHLTIRAILKNNIDNFPLYLSERKNSEKKKKKKINLKINFSRNDVNLNSNRIRFYTSYSQVKPINSRNKIDLLKEKGISEHYSKNKKMKNLKINKTNLKKLGIKMKLSKTINKFKFLKSYDNPENKTNIIKKSLSFSVTNLNSYKLGRISIFAVFEEIGIHGRIICSTMINYLTEYFRSSKEMNVCIDRNNYYSILHWSFMNAQNYLLKNEKKLKINLSHSGCMVCFLLLPKDYTNKIYCANSGLCKCLLYTNRGPDIFSFSLTIDRPSERERVYLFHKNKQISKILNSLNEENIGENNDDKNAKKTKNNNKMKKDNNVVKSDKADNDNNEDNFSNDKDNSEKQIEEDKSINEEQNEDDNENKNDIIIEESRKNIKLETIKINEKELQNDQDKSIKYFKALGFTRCFGIISGADYGLVPDPELNECDLKVSKVKFTVMGNYTFWRLLNEVEIGKIISKYYSNKDLIGANKELWDLIRQKVGTNSKVLDKCGFEVIYFDNFL